jgi:hypothetical protein
MRKALQGTGDTRNHDTMVRQGISMDFEFIVQRSKDPTPFEKFLVLNGEASYLIIAGHYIDLLWGLATTGKSPPIAWLNHWFVLCHPHQPPFAMLPWLMVVKWHVIPMF